MNLPMHACSSFVVDLHAIHPAVAFAGLRVLGEHERHGDVAAAVFGPTVDDRQVKEREMSLFEYPFFAWPITGYPGEHPAKIGKAREHLDLLDQALGRFDVHQLDNTLGYLGIIADAERQQHSLTAAERIDQYRNRVTFDVFKQ